MTAARRANLVPCILLCAVVLIWCPIGPRGRILRGPSSPCPSHATASEANVLAASAPPTVIVQLSNQLTPVRTHVC